MGMVRYGLFLVDLSNTDESCIGIDWNLSTLSRELNDKEALR